MEEYEKLGHFYLGKTADPKSGRARDELVLYDAKDLTTHAVIIGMTGSGKTGLGIGLLEEALIDNIPVIAVDPKGDLPNLMLRFPNLSPEDFQPWVNAQDALAMGRTLTRHAGEQARKWQQGLEAWHQAPARIDRYVQSAEICVYTPGSRAGQPVSVLRAFDPPPDEIMADSDLMTERIQSTTTGLLALLGMDADPVASREHIFLATIFDTVWRTGRSLDLAALIHAIQKPPFQRIGVMDVNAVYPEQARFELAMRLNNLLAAPGFDAWMEGDPLDIGRLLRDDQGRARASVFSIAHLPDDQRMFFVTRLLNDLLGWMRTQPGTGSLRAIFYMDEVFGYFPPIKSPPTKAPMLTLLKQARAYGLGLVLATQNPVDLDYKGLSNTGTWFIGRLQTEQDKDRVLDGLAGATPAVSGTTFDRKAMGQLISGLGQRRFLLHNVHETTPRIFQTRWTLSYLAGPMTREQIKALKTLKAKEDAARGRHGRADATGQKDAHPVPDSAAALPASSSMPSHPARPLDLPPTLPPGINIGFLAASGAGRHLFYLPAVLGRIDIHYASVKYKISENTTLSLFAEITDGPIPVAWGDAVPIRLDPDDLTPEPLSGATFGELAPAGLKVANHKKWARDLLRWVRQNHPLELFRSRTFRMTSLPGETEGAFRGRLAQHIREARDLAVEKLRKKYARSFQTQQDRLMRAEQAVEREADQVKTKKIETAISFGSAILGAFLGQKTVSVTTTRRMGSALKSAGRIQKESMDVERAQEKAAAARERLETLEAQFQADLSALDLSFDATAETLETVRIFPKTTDLHLALFTLAWLPYRREESGQLIPDWR